MIFTNTNGWSAADFVGEEPEAVITSTPLPPIQLALKLDKSPCEKSFSNIQTKKKLCLGSKRPPL